MKAAVYYETGTPDVFRYEDVPDPIVGAGDITRLGDADVVIQDPNSGGIDFTNMVNGAFSNWVSLGSTPGWNGISRRHC